MTDPGIEHLVFLASRRRSDHLARILLSPGLVPWDMTDEGAFLSGIPRLRHYIQGLAGLRPLLDLNLLGFFLLKRNRAPAWLAEFIQDELDPENILGGLGLGHALEGRWQAAPVPLILDRSEIRWFLCGLVPGGGLHPRLPAWAERVLDEGARRSVASAAAAASCSAPLPEGYGFACLPLLLPNQKLQCRGRSLGLPLALGFLSLLDREDMGKGFMATGAIREDGRVHPVEGLRDKMFLAAENGFNLFLHPAQEALGPPPGLEAIPVDRLDEARMFAELHRPGNSRDLVLFSSMLEDPERFLANSGRIRPAWIRWAAKGGLLEEIKAGMTSSAEYLDAWAGRMKAALQRGDLERAAALSSIMETGDLERSVQISPRAVFRALAWRMILAQRQGRPKDALQTAKRAEKVLMKGAAASDPEAAAIYWNHYLLALHTLYSFSPDLPEGLAGVLEALEGQFRNYMPTGCKVHSALGALYGTISQHFGFCGPTHLPDVEHYTRLAMEAFGGGEVPERRDDFLRQYNHLTYAYLDAGDHDSARKALMAHCEVASGKDILKAVTQDPTPWKHALVARFLADTGGSSLDRPYLDLAATAGRPWSHLHHPNQLWLFNLGRIALLLGREHQASTLWRKSLECCLSGSNGPAVRVMALLPLSRLHELGAAESGEIDPALRTIKAAAEALDSGHFEVVLQAESQEEILSAGLRDPESIFPFSYR